MTEPDLLRLLASLGLIVALIFLLAWLSRRLQQLRGDKQAALRVLAAQSLGGRNSIAIIETEDCRLVVGITSTQITLLHTLPPGHSPQASETPSTVVGPVKAGGFARLLANAKNKP